MGGKGLDTVSVEKSLQYLFLSQRGKLEAPRKATHAGTRVGNRAQDYRDKALHLLGTSSGVGTSCSWVIEVTQSLVVCLRCKDGRVFPNS